MANWQGTMQRRAAKRRRATYTTHDELEQLIQEEEKKSPGFTKKVDAALARRRNARAK